MALNSGTETLQQIGAGATGRVIRNVWEEIKYLDPTETPFLAMTQLVASKPTTSYQFEHWERRGIYRQGTVSGAITNVATSVTVVDGTQFRQWDMAINVRTKEMFQITSVATNTLTVVRGIGGTGVAMNDGDILAITEAFRFGSDMPTPLSAQPTRVENFTQIFRDPYKLPRTLRQTSVYGGDEQARLRREAGVMHKIAIEKALLFGVKSSSEADQQFTTQGLTNCGITSWNVSGNLTKATLDAKIGEICQYGSESKFALVNLNMSNYINFLADKYIKIDQSNTMFGWQIQTYRAPNGIIKLKNHRLLNRLFPTQGVMILVDPDNVKLRPLYETTMEEWTIPGFDGSCGEYLTELGLQTFLPESHGFFYGATGTA